MVLKRGVQHSPLGGDYVSSQIRALFKSNSPQPITVTPHYLISSKTAVEAGQPAQAIYKTFPADKAPDASYRKLLEERTLTEFKECVVQVWPGPNKLSSTGPNGISNEDIAKGSPADPSSSPMDTTNSSVRNGTASPNPSSMQRHTSKTPNLNSRHLPQHKRFQNSSRTPSTQSTSISDLICYKTWSSPARPVFCTVSTIV